MSDLLSLIAYSCRRTAKPPLPESRAAEAEARAAEASGEEATIKVVHGSTTRMAAVRDHGAHKQMWRTTNGWHGISSNSCSRHTMRRRTMRGAMGPTEHNNEEPSALLVPKATLRTTTHRCQHHAHINGLPWINLEP